MSGVVIDATARVAGAAAIGRDVSIGPYCVVGPDVALGDGCRLVAHVHLTGHTSIGPRTVIHPFASLGSPPQSVKYRGGPSTGTEDDRGVTEVGDRCFLMVGSHVAHDCKVGNDVTFANDVVLAGHVSVGDYVVFGGGVAVRQHVRIGEGAMIVGLSGVRADLIPFGCAHGLLANLIGLNVVGLRRRGVARADIRRLRQAYEILFFGAGAFRDRVESVAADFSDHPIVARVVDFIRTGGGRPLTMATDRHDTGEAAVGTTP
jgi:UDP-N-acetylglucosamine acyltransferase